MDIEHTNNAKYVVLKSLKHGKSALINFADDKAIAEFRAKYGNEDLAISTSFTTAFDASSPRNYCPYFHIVSNDLEETRISTLEAIFYISENFQIPQECIEAIYTDGGMVGNEAIENGGTGDNDGSINNVIAGPNNSSNKHNNNNNEHDIGENIVSTGNSVNSYTGAKNKNAANINIKISTPAETVPQTAETGRTDERQW